MAKKQAKIETTPVVEVESVIETVVKPTPEITQYALSMIQNDDETYSVLKIGINPKEGYVSPTIEVVETNTDKYIIQERLSVLLFDLDNTVLL